jgi:hypothetical protein
MTKIRWRSAVVVLVVAAAVALVPGTPAAAATVRLTPNGDVANAWQVNPSGAAYAAVDDPISQPDPVPATDGIWAGATGRVAELGMSTTTLGSNYVPSGQVWFYANTGATTQLLVEVLWRGAVRKSVTVQVGQGFAWRSVAVTPSRQADVDDLRVRFTAVAGGDTNVRAVYADLDTAPLLQQQDWEASQAVPPAGWNRQACCAWSTGVQHSPVRSGANAIRFDLRYGDLASPTLKSRAELTTSTPDADHVERWYGFSIYLPSTYWATDASAEILTQWHQHGDQGSPPLSVGARNAHWEVAFQGVPLSSPTLAAAEYARDTWTDWVVHVNWSSGTDGFFEVWRNSTPVQFVNPTTHATTTRINGANKPNDGFGVYTKFGIYKWAWNDGPSQVSERAIQYDDLRIADGSASYSAVAP